MNGLCPDCGARLGAGDSVCRACGLPMPPGAVVTRARRAGAEVRSGAPGPIPASIPGPAPSLIPSSIPASIPSPKAGRIEFGDSPDPDRSVIALYYGEELLLRDIGVVLGVTESRVSQIHSRALYRLNRELSVIVDQIAEATAAWEDSATKLMEMEQP